MVKTPPCHGEDPGSIPGDGANFTHPPSPNPHPPSPNFMLHHYRLSIEPPASLPLSLQSYADALWIHYTVFPDGSIFADMPGGCLIIEGAAGYGADAGRSLAG